ncbi:MAG: hypothetical protein L3J51_08885 [Cocleimonas sp.]|nr:hypothetical protein [Cocleimonas sp.]
MNKKALSLAISLALTIPTLTNALSLGDIESNSSLNQPFRGKINLHSTSAAEAKTLKVRVASAAVFNRVGIDRPAFLNSIRFRTTVQNGKPVILVSSNQPINEPFLNFLLEVSWPNGQLLKEYTVLLDPPVLMRPDTAIASNNAGVRAEPRAQGRITRPAARSPQMTQQQRQAQAQRQAQQQRQVQAQRRAQQQAARPRARTEAEIFADTARRILGQTAQQPSARTTARSARRVASVGRTYRVRRGDTLSLIAKKIGQRGVRSEQMMVALFEKNRNAFAQNNMNILKSGVLLKRPTAAEAKAVTRSQAKAQIAAQAREWKNARGQAVASTGSKSTSKVASNNQARMTVAGTNGSASAGTSGNGDIAELNKQLTMTKESLTSKQKENEELKSRVTELQSLLRKKNRLITLKSEQLATLQATASVTPETAEVTEASEPEVNMDPVVESESEIQAGIASELTKGQDDGVIIRDGGEQAEMTPEQLLAITEKELSDPAPAVVEQAPEVESVVEPVTEESGTDILGLLSSPTVLGSGAALGLLGLGGLWFMRRRKEDDFDFDSSEMSSINIDTQMGDDNDEEVSFDDSPIDESEFVSDDEPSQATETVSDAEADGDEDILQEADVYIVYGLHDQAESELKQAIEKDPTNMAFRAKLLENYKAAGDVEAFEEETKVFLSIDSADKDKYLDDIKGWGSSLNPGNNLFSEASMTAATGAGVAMVAGTAAAASDEIEVLAESDLDILDGLETDELEDINLDDILSDDGLIDNSDDIALGIDDVSDDSFEEITADLETEIGSVDDLLDASDEIDLSEGLDLDFDTGLEGSSDTFETVGEINLDDVSEDGDLDITNLSLDIDGDDFDKIMPEDNAYKSSVKEEVTEVASDVTDLDLDLDGEDNLLADFDDNLSFLDLDDDAEVIEETQVETKLDLAKAYIDMGDIEGARSTLEEVMADGSDDQKREAEELLQKTG